MTPTGPALFVANFRSNMVEMFDTNFAFVTWFTDPAMGPLGYAPFSIRTFQDKLVVTYAKTGSTLTTMTSPGRATVTWMCSMWMGRWCGVLRRKERWIRRGGWRLRRITLENSAGRC